MSALKYIGCLVAVLGLTACSEEAETTVTNQVASLVLGTNTAPAARPRSSVDEQELLANPGKYLRVNIRDLGATDTMVAVAENGARTTWIGPAGTSVTLEEGIVVATRGLPRDLMGADATATAQALRTGGGTVVRRHDFLDDSDQIIPFVMDCQIAPKSVEMVNRLGQSTPAVRFEELCSADGLTLTNVYWLNAEGEIIRSLQAVSPDAGYLQLDAF